MKTVLVLGAGSVAGPCIDYLLRKGKCKVVVADISSKNLAAIAKNCPSAEIVEKDVSMFAGELLDQYQPTVVVNLMPPVLMPYVSKLCLEKKIHQIHPAYLDAETKNLDEECKKTGLVFIAELGLDPGIDHMSAASRIKELHDKGGSVESFHSYCGALPAQDANTNPWGYKLSWSPESLIGASKRDARILCDGLEYNWPGGITYEYVELYEVPTMGTFEVYANGNSIPYVELYGIPETKNIYRGTIRYNGWCETICYMNSLGFFEQNKQNTKGLTFAAFTARQSGTCEKDPEAALCNALKLKPWSAFILRMKWLGFFDERPLPFNEGSARDVVAVLFAEKLIFTPTERDLVILRDEIKVSYPNGKKQTYYSTLIDYGVPGKWSSIARTTGIPPAIAARLVMEGKIATAGVHIPILPEIYEPLLVELKNEGIELKESVINA